MWWWSAGSRWSGCCTWQGATAGARGVGGGGGGGIVITWCGPRRNACPVQCNAGAGGALLSRVVGCNSQVCPNLPRGPADVFGQVDQHILTNSVLAPLITCDSQCTWKCVTYQVCKEARYAARARVRSTGVAFYCQAPCTCFPRCCQMSADRIVDLVYHVGCVLLPLIPS
jgi:hypothetical protein